MQTLLQSAVVFGCLTLALLILCLWARRMQARHAEEVVAKLKTESFTWSLVQNAQEFRGETIVIHVQGDMAQGNFDIDVWPLENGQVDEERRCRFSYEKFKPVSRNAIEEVLRGMIYKLLAAVRQQAVWDAENLPLWEDGQGI